MNNKKHEPDKNETGWAYEPKFRLPQENKNI
jgi:hypothetical protein